jgi:hypothetical protein
MNDLRRTFPNGLPPGARLFSVDPTGLNSNIDTDHGIDVLAQWLRNYREDLPTCMPVEFVIEALAKIMQSNIFQFGDTYRKQTRGHQRSRQLCLPLLDEHENSNKENPRNREPGCIYTIEY